MPEPSQPGPPGPSIAPGPDPQALAGVEEVWQAALALARDQERLRQALAARLGLRPPAFSLLQAAAQAPEPGLTVSEAATLLGVRPQALSGPAAELGEAGLMQRAVDAADARSRRLVLTEAGRERWGQAAELRRALLAEILAQVPHPSVAKLVLSRLGLAVGRALAMAEQAEESLPAAPVS